MDSNLALRNAIALNNMGISLLERHCYGQGLETLKDSVSLLKTFVQDDDARTSSSSTVFDKCFKERYHATLQRLAQPMPFNRHVAVIDVITTGSGHKPVASIIRQDPSLNISLIRIDDVDFQDHSSNSFDLQCAALLHNLGLAYLCIARCSASPSQRRMSCSDIPGRSNIRNYNMIAVKIFRMAHSLYSKLLSSKQRRTECAEIPHLAAANVLGLIQALQCANQVNEAKAYQAVLNRLTMTCKQVEMTEFFIFSNGLPKSAAAA